MRSFEFVVESICCEACFEPEFSCSFISLGRLAWICEWVLASTFCVFTRLDRMLFLASLRDA